MLVTVKVADADERQHREFDREMARRSWAPLPGHAWTWCTEVFGSATDRDAVAEAEADVTWSAEAAGVYSWDAVCVIADETGSNPRRAPAASGEVTRAGRLDGRERTGSSNRCRPLRPGQAASPAAPLSRLRRLDDEMECAVGPG